MTLWAADWSKSSFDSHLQSDAVRPLQDLYVEDLCEANCEVYTQWSASKTHHVKHQGITRNNGNR